MFARVKGTEDLLDLYLHNFVLHTAARHLERCNFSEISTPILEHTNLFVRSLGTETDVVTKEMYTFQTKGGEEICLRPEATASTMRAFLEHHVEEKPWRVFSYGPMFRHERPQKGRWRQFSQINIEVINSGDIRQDAYFISTLNRLFSEVLQLDDYVLKLNFLGSSNDRARYRELLHIYVQEHSTQLCETCQIRKDKNILRVLDCKNETCQLLYKKGPTLLSVLSPESKERWELLTNTMQELSVTFVNDPFLVRGLDYYNDTVFEFSSNALGAQNAFCGGGRYDGLAEQLGSSTTIPAIGASIGMGRLLLLVEQIQNKLSIPAKPALHVIIPMEPAYETTGILLAEHLQRAGLCSDVLLDGGSIKSMMRRANKMNAAFVLIIGQDEAKSGTITIKNMMTGASQTVPQAQVLTHLRPSSTQH